MDNERYRVVLTGHLVGGFSREAVIASLSRLFEISAGRLIGVFEGREYPIDEEMGAHQAAALQQRLEGLGARARVERVDDQAQAHGDLHLPNRGEPGAAGLMRCPACGHQQLVARRCDECGIVFAEYNRGRAGHPRPPEPPARPRPPSPRPPAHTAAPLERAHQRAAGSQNIHARETAGWHDAWVDDGNDLPTEQYHLKLYMGRSGSHLVDACQRMMLGPRTHLALSWSVTAMISPFLWAMYRKMWAWGAVIFVAEVLLPVLLIALGSKDGISDKLTYVGIAGLVANRLFWPAILKYLYCRHARSAIAYMNRMSPTYASDIDIATAGGTSKTSVFVGIVVAIVVSLLTWSIVDTAHAHFMQAKPQFSEPPPAPAWTQPAAPSAESPTTALSEENKWVATRSKLRVLGQRLNTWFGAAGADVDPQRLSMADIGQALLLGFDATIDGWGKQIQYRYDGDGYLLISAGPDGVFDSSDDVTYRRSLRP
ncbi:MAG: DUF2628 domain-containing protein [Gammaproteobacteria bacterium]|nr:DUF2628 domain-containing protein [Gammaproteobacteria bacterium]